MSNSAPLMQPAIELLHNITMESRQLTAFASSVQVQKEKSDINNSHKSIEVMMKNSVWQTISVQTQSG